MTVAMTSILIVMSVCALSRLVYRGREWMYHDEGSCTCPGAYVATPADSQH